MLALLLLGLALGAAAGYWWVRRPKKAPYLLHLEYWVYLPGDALPPQDAIMTRLIDSRAVGSSEALLFSDVRLHIALVLRSKNAHVFRPDLLEPHVDATPEQLGTLEASRSLVKVRFVSEEPVGDRRPLTFLPQVARIVAELGGGSLVYDSVGERLLSVESLREGDPGPHVRWVSLASGSHVRTHGLKKVGLPEIETEPVLPDQRWIVTEIVEQVAGAAWKSGELPEVGHAEAFDDRFEATFVREGAVARARIRRIQGV